MFETELASCTELPPRFFSIALLIDEFAQVVLGRLDMAVAAYSGVWPCQAQIDQRLIRSYRYKRGACSRGISVAALSLRTRR